jgi:hypothetical protein
MAGYSGTPLAKKLGIKEGSRLLAVHAPANYKQLLEPLPASVRFVKSAGADTDLVHFFALKADELQRALTDYRARLNPTATIWVSWPKKSAKVPTDITEDVIRDIALPLGFVDINVCAVDETWSGLKLVVRVANR